MVDLRPRVTYALSLDFLDSDGAHFECACDNHDDGCEYVTVSVPRGKWEELDRPGHITVLIGPGWAGVDE